MKEFIHSIFLCGAIALLTFAAPFFIPVPNICVCELWVLVQVPGAWFLQVPECCYDALADLLLVV